VGGVVAVGRVRRLHLSAPLPPAVVDIADVVGVDDDVVVGPLRTRRRSSRFAPARPPWPR